MQLSKYINRQSIGASLVACGVPYGMYFNFLYPNGLGGIRWSPVFMALSVILLINWNNLIKFHFPSFSKVFGFLIGFQMIMMFYGTFSSNMTDQYLTFHLYIMALCISISTVSDFSKFDYFPETLFLITIPLSIMGVFYMATGMMVGDDAYLSKMYDDDYALEPFTASFGMLINMMSVLCIKSKNIIYKILLIISFAAGIYFILFTSKRTPLLVFFVSLLIFMYLQNKFDKKSIGRLVVYAMGGIMVIILLSIFVPTIGDQATMVLNNFTSGFRNLIGDTTVSDDSGSAIARLENRRWAYNYINSSFTSINWIFGGGYMVRWLDNPILESYLDMGIIGFGFYLTLIVFFPIRILFKKIKDNNVMLSLMISSYAIVSIFNSGNPYQYIKYTPIVLLSFFVTSYYRSIKSNCSINSNKSNTCNSTPLYPKR